MFLINLYIYLFYPSGFIYVHRLKKSRNLIKFMSVQVCSIDVLEYPECHFDQFEDTFLIS